MKGKKLIIVAIIIVIALAILFVLRHSSKSTAVKKAAPVTAAKADKAKTAATAAKAPLAKKTFTKGMGGLTVNIKGSGERQIPVKVRAFKIGDKNIGVYITSFTTNRMQEILPGTYDIEVDTAPQTIYKGITVSADKETVKDLGQVTGSITVKALNSKKEEASMAVRVMHAGSSFLAATIPTNRRVDIMPGNYDVNIEMTPRIVKNNFKIETGKENVLDLGVVSGGLIVKAVDENGKEARIGVRVKESGKNTIVAFSVTNNPLEVAPGTYDVEAMSTPPQIKKDVKIVAGEETAIEVVPPPKPAEPTPAPAATPVKKK